MSGPKIQIYALTKEARENALAQLRCDRQAIACFRQLEKLKGACLEKRSALEQTLALTELLQKREGIAGTAPEAQQALLDETDGALAGLREMLAGEKPQLQSVYRFSPEELAKKQRYLERLRAAGSRAQAVLRQLEEAEKTDSGTRADIAAAAETGIAREISAAAAESFAGEGEDAFTARREAARGTLRKLLGEEGAGIPAELRQEAAQALEALERIAGLQQLSSFEKITLRRICLEAEKQREAAEQAAAAARERLAQYEALCELAGIEAEKFPAGDVPPERIRQLEERILQQREQAYIADCVDEVMQEIGYDLIGRREVRKKSGKQFRNELYRFGEGTAVNVTYAPDGQISMELGGITGEDRLPTEAETAHLVQEMETFCGEFAEFERRMRERGILVGSRIALLPPEAAYAAMINVTEYEVAEGADLQALLREGAAAGKRAAGKRQERKAVPQDMHRED